MMETLLGLGIYGSLLKADVREIYYFKTLISTLQIYGMLDCGRDGFRRIWKEIKIIKSSSI